MALKIALKQDSLKQAYQNPDTYGAWSSTNSHSIFITFITVIKLNLMIWIQKNKKDLDMCMAKYHCKY